MKLKNIKLEDIKQNKVYVYLDEENINVDEAKVKKIKEDSGYYLISGEIEIKDKTKYPAIIGISSDDSGELFEAFFWIESELVSQSDKNFLEKMGKNRESIFPYMYHLNVKVEGDLNKKVQY